MADLPPRAPASTGPTTTDMMTLWGYCGAASALGAFLAIVLRTLAAMW